MFTRYETTTARINNEENQEGMQPEPPVPLPLELKDGDFHPAAEGVEVIVKGVPVRSTGVYQLLSQRKSQQA